MPKDVEELKKVPLWWLLLAAGGVLLFSCQICTIGFIYCCRRGRYEGRSFWYRGRMSYAVDQVGCCASAPENLPSKIVGELQHDLRTFRAYWSGQWGRDYRFHVANFHPLISIFCCHPLHPFGKVARTIVLAITVAFMVGWRRIVQEHVFGLPGHLDKELSGRMHGAAQMLHVHVRGQMVIFFYVTLPSMIAETFLTKLAMLHDSIRDFHREYGDRTCCTKFVSWFITLMGWIAVVVFYVLACASLAFLVYTVHLLRGKLKLGQGNEELYYFVVLMPQSLAQIWFVWWFICDLFAPYVGFGLCYAAQKIPCLSLCRWQWWLEEEAVVQEPAWRVADTAHAHFGAEIDEYLNESMSVLREEAGLVHDSEQKRWVAVERVAQKDLEAWVTSKMTGAKRGQELLTQVEAHRAFQRGLHENECMELAPCCLPPKRARGVFGWGLAM